jgi:HAD superfamily hydrolase (TIGR01509 family)
MDGLLTASEARWRIAEREMAASLNLPLSEHDFESTMGVRMSDVAQRWFEWHPWGADPTPSEVARLVVDRVVELTADAVALPGVETALDLVAERGWSIALCSSSDRRLIDATLGALGLGDRFAVVHSAERDAYGKPHPEPYLATARELGVDPSACVVFEDAISGCVAAKAAGMAVVAVPESRGSVGFGLADLVLDSLAHLGQGELDAIEVGRVLPSLSRPRFHLAFPVDDLGRARWFYGEVLGCPEGRSASDWVDFDLWGHQIVAHLVDGREGAVAANTVDGHAVPTRHFGLLVPGSAWRDLIARLQAAAVTFIIEPTTRFAGRPGEQSTAFVLDPAGNALEFKSFADDRSTFDPTPPVPSAS